jgi:ArsR family transcriptional regulator, arsenate/arsenite/antimonite-responsive transcriptional repressor / arsenate reductase (thioredoxin)
MYEQLSKRVDTVFKLANEIARGDELDYVGTEHVLLAINQEGTGLGAEILRRHGASHEKLKTEIAKLIQASLEDTWVFGRLPGTPHFRNVVALAIEEAQLLKNTQVCTEHLLLGLLGEKGCVAQKALKALGLNAKQVREELVKLQAKQANA